MEILQDVLEHIIPFAEAGCEFVVGCKKNFDCCGKNFGWLQNNSGDTKKNSDCSQSNLDKQLRKASRLTTRLYFKVIKCSGACRQTILMDKRTPAGPPYVRGPAWVQDLPSKTDSVDGRTI